MVEEGIFIRYRGFDPDQVAKNRIKVLGEVLKCEAPSESYIKMTFVNGGDAGYSGFLRINSSEGSFFTKARDQDLGALANKLVEKVRKQIRNWKGVRFHIPDSIHKETRDV